MGIGRIYRAKAVDFTTAMLQVQRQCTDQRAQRKAANPLAALLAATPSK